MRRHVVAALFVVLAVWSAGRASLRAVDPVGAQDATAEFRSSADRVTVDVSVRRSGRPVTGLALSDFEIYDNGVRQDVADVSYEQLPVDVTVALDVSASVTGVLLDELRRAVRQLQTDLVARDRLRVFAFNMGVREVAGFTAGSTRPASALDTIKAGGGSAIFDTLAVTLTGPLAADRRQLVVLFTDGHDTSSITSPPVLLDVVRNTTPTVHVVVAASAAVSAGLQTPQAQAVDAGFRQVLGEIATETGGSLVRMRPGDNLTSTFRRILGEFRSSYVLRYAPRDVRRDGFHKIEVRIARAGSFDVRARNGYTWR